MSDIMAPDNAVDTHDIEALVDGELAPDQANSIRARIMTDPAAKARYDALCHQKQLLKHWWQARTTN